MRRTEQLQIRVTAEQKAALKRLARSAGQSLSSYVLARALLADAVAPAPAELDGLSPLLQNDVAAMVEQACHRRRVPPPAWATQVAPLTEPHFATSLRSLRLHLLRAAPVPFKRRNLFVDSGVGARV